MLVRNFPGEFEINAHRFLVSAGAPELLWFLEAETYTSCRRNSETSETVNIVLDIFSPHFEI